MWGDGDGRGRIGEGREPWQGVLSPRGPWGGWRACLDRAKGVQAGQWAYLVHVDHEGAPAARRRLLLLPGVGEGAAQGEGWVD